MCLEMELRFWFCFLVSSLASASSEVAKDDEANTGNSVVKPPICSSHQSCRSCVQQRTCGYCSLPDKPTVGVCVDGDSSEPIISCRTGVSKRFPNVTFESSRLVWSYENCPTLNACLPDSSDCHANASCRITAHGFTCVCNEGFKGDGLSGCLPCDHNCDADDEEALPDREYVKGNKCVNGICVENSNDCIRTTNGSCDCKPGFSAEGNVCRPICSQGCVHGDCVAPNQCQCKFGYIGSNCSYKCNCNGHSSCLDLKRLDYCYDCQNNTQGAHCQKCKPFFVGNPTNEGKCVPCRIFCSGHSDICLSQGFMNKHKGIAWEKVRTITHLAGLVTEGSENSETVCLNCLHNTEGNRCDTCIAGYFKAGDSIYDGCQPCHCHGHGDMCDPSNGETCNCSNNTENDRQCVGKHSKNQVTPCWQLQCSRCKEYFFGVPTHGHQCYRHMFIDREYCFDPETQEECNRKPNPLLLSRTVFFAVQPKYMNVDIRIVIDVSEGELDLFFSAKEDTFVVDVNKTNGVHNVWLDPHYNAEYGESDRDLIILRKNYVFTNISQPQSSTIHHGAPLRIKHHRVRGLTAYITVTDPSELFVVRGLDSRLVITIPQEVHDLRSTRFYIILKGTKSKTFGNLFFRQDQSRIDLFVFFSVFFSCFFLFLAACVVVWKIKQAFDMRRARRLHAAEMKHMASRPFASVLVCLDPISINDDFEFALSTLTHPVQGKRNKSTFRIRGSHSSLRDSPKYQGNSRDSDHYLIRPVAVEITADGLSAVVTTIVILPGGSSCPVRMALTSSLVSLRGSHQILTQCGSAAAASGVFRSAMRRRTTNLAL